MTSLAPEKASFRPEVVSDDAEDVRELNDLVGEQRCAGFGGRDGLTLDCCCCFEIDDSAVAEAEMKNEIELRQMPLLRNISSFPKCKSTALTDERGIEKMVQVENRFAPIVEGAVDLSKHIFRSFHKKSN